MNHNILITSAGKRVSLVKQFQGELGKFFPGAKVFTCDREPAMVPAGMVSEKCFPVSRVGEENYFQELKDICRENGVGMVVPTIDTELPVLAAWKEEFKAEGIHLVVSDSGFIEICRDKRNTHLFFKKSGIPFPAPLDKFHPVFPLFAKPYDGSLSRNIHVIRNQSQLTPEILEDPKLMFMEYVDPEEYTEYTVDMYYGRDHRVKSIVPRERLEVRAGEISKGITRKNGLVAFLKDRLHDLPGVEGCICMQLFYKENEEKVWGIEINPRFGGGYPLSYYAGADYPAYLIREHFLGEEIAYSEDWLDKTLMLRYDDEVIVYDAGR